MSEKRDADNRAIHGLSIVDTDADNSQSEEEKMLKFDDNSLVIKTEDEANDTNTTDNDYTCEVTVAEDSLEEVEEKINLFDVLNEKEPEKETKDTFHNSTLIITTEEHLDTITVDDTLNTSCETVKNVKINESATTDSGLEDLKKVLPKTTPKTDEHNYFWVSNISRQVKATDLKKYFSQMGKVMTAKVLTNGKNYFGYVSVDSAETAGRCVKQLNNSMFDSKRITVTKDRPDYREPKSMAKLETRKKRNEKLELKKENKAVESKIVEEKTEGKTSKAPEEDEVKTNSVIADLKKKIEKFKAETTKYKWKIVEYQRRHEGMRKKCSNLEKELKETQYKMRADRRRLNQEREQFEKTKKLEQIRMEADKTLVNKELGEVKKLREHLKIKIDEMKVQAKKTTKRRGSRSPPPPIEHIRSPRGRSPIVRVGSRIGYRSDDRMDKKRKRDDPPRGRTPPPPPKLSNGMGKKRGDNQSHRQYFEDVEKRSSAMDHGHGYDYRHKQTFAAPQEMSRAPWQPPYSKDPRRMNTAPSGGGPNYPADPRYGGGYQFPPSSITVPQRSYYPEFGKPYGHY